MTVRVVTPPEPIVSWADAKAQLRESSDDEKAYVETLIAAASAWIDGPGGWLGRAIGPQLLEWRLDAWPSGECFRLPYPPLIEVDQVTYVDAQGNEQPWVFPTPLYFDNMPAIRGRSGDIRIRYWAGYGKRDDSDPEKWVLTVPPGIRIAILLLVGHWFHNREAVVVGQAPVALPLGVESLLSTFRVYV